jgi:hypothetical protein
LQIGALSWSRIRRVGLSAVSGYLDYVLLPAIALCLGVVVYGLTKGKPA